MVATLSTQSLVAAWEQFLTDYYKVRIEEAALNYPETRSIEVDYNDLDRRDPQLAQYLLDHPRASLQSADDALKLIEVPVDPRPALRVRVRNLPRVNRHLVRKLRAEHLGKFVAVEGLVKKVVEVRPKLRDATFQCQRCGAVFNMPQEDQILVEPKSCDEGQGGCGRDGPFKLLTEESRFIDSQKLEIQESHEDLRGGAQPERISVYLEEDLTGRLYPGDAVVINGIFRAQQRRQGSYKLAEFTKVLDCVSFEVQQLEFEEIEIRPEDVPEILKIAGNDPLKTIKDSFAPEIYGMDDVKEALIMSLFGGVAKEFKDGTRIRGDIHCLLVGDPGVAKCLRGDSIVPLATGDRPTIAMLAEEAMRGERNEVDDGWWAPLRVPVYSMDERGRVGVKWSSKAWKRTAPPEMVRVTTRSGRTVEVTQTHPLFMTDGLVVHPREAGRIQVGDHVAAPRRFPLLASRDAAKGDVAQIAASSGPSNSSLDVIPVYTRFFRDMRAGLKLSQGACGVARSTWLGLERGQKRPTRATYAAVSHRFVEAALETPELEDGYADAARRMATLSQSDLFWDEVVSVERVAPSEAYVYDLEVPGTHNFVANGIVNHNSQILRYTSKLSPRSIYTSGKGSSAAGLTATAVRDEFGEGQWSLEAGALVLADKGVCLVDEMDKMEEYDQSALHQAMEQQEISISKAGISATLKSRCAVIGAANPKTGRFDDYSPIVQQINMPPPLLSRFDLIFSLRDKPNRDIDEKIARHILGTHRAGEVHEARKRQPDGPYTEEQERALMRRILPVIDERLLRRYVAYAKRNFYPVLTEEAADRINSFYQQLRNQATGTIGITPRQIEALIRLAEASARLRLSNIATVEDADKAVRIFGVFLRTVGWNEEAGTFDIDIIAAGASSSQQQRMRQILEIIRRLTAESGGEGAKEDDIKKEAAALAPPIPAEKVGEALTILKERGSIFQPRHGRFQPL